MKNFRKALSLALIVIGIFLLASPVVLARFATIIFGPSWTFNVYPDGTLNSPSPLDPDATMTLHCSIRYYDPTGLGEVLGEFTVTVDIAETGEHKQLQFKDSQLSGDYILLLYTCDWKVPMTSNQIYTFNWRVTFTSEGEQYVKTKTTYGKTVEVEPPDGYFTINGETADENSIHRVQDATVLFGFVPTKKAEYIVSVYVEIYKEGTKIGKVTLALKPDGTREASYTLPGYGTYTVEGYFTWTGHEDKPIRKMTVMVGWGEQPPTITLTSLQILGIVCIALGAVLYLTREK